MKIRDIAVSAFLTAIMYLQQVALSPLPNIHLCALLLILYTLYFPKLVFPVTAAFILLEGVTYGFGMWWISYLYTWPLLIAIVLIFRKNQSKWFWASIGGGFGLIYGALCAIPYLFAGGIPAAVAYWVSGIPFDILHCLGNFAAIVLLWKPMERVFKKLGGSMKTGV